MRLVWLGLAAALPLLLTSDYTLGLANLALISLMAVLGLNFIAGLTGQISFAQAAFAGIGAYFSTLMMKAGLSTLAAIPIAAMGAALCSLLLGVPALRLRSYYLAMATIGFGEIVRLVLVNWVDVTGAPRVCATCRRCQSAAMRCMAICGFSTCCWRW